ncbi:MAG: replication initiator protein [Microviridae sp.]|nr:MAG: replication initiator protein [Microviridae sp.]
MRCMHEKRLHRENCFITLTYDNEHLPPFGTLVKRDLQLFMKRLRKEFGDGIRFYGCGEYGDLNKRPHYHVLLFNHDFSDKRKIGANRRGDNYYSSAVLSRLWPMGHNLLGEVTFDSAAYVARYVMKKLTGPPAKGAYDVRDGDGVIHTRIPEFTCMSRRPGIGRGWYDRYGRETYAHDNCVVNGVLVRPPRFYDTKFELEDPARLAVLKSIRRQRALRDWKENLIDRRRVKERVAIAALSKLHREI